MIPKTRFVPPSDRDESWRQQIYQQAVTCWSDSPYRPIFQFGDVYTSRQCFDEREI
jgi:hypothetical protein